MAEDRLTTELMREVKNNAKKWFIIAIALLVVLFASNMAWLYYWNLPSEDTVIEQDNDKGYNNYIGNNGDISNGETDHQNNQKK